MKQLKLDLKDQIFTWQSFLFSSPEEKDPFVTVVNAYTEQQALFLAGKRLGKRYDKKYSFAKKIS